MRGSHLQIGIDFVSRLFGVSNQSLHKWLAEGKLKSLEPEDIIVLVREQVRAELDKEYKRKYSQLLVNDSSPSPAPVPATSPDTSQDTSPAPSLKEENVSPSPSWFGKPNPWTEEELDDVPVSSSPKKHWLDEVADQVEAAESSGKKKLFR
jgi:hypothetical protein